MSFRNIIGQPAAELLRSAIKNNRLAHAYIFLGPSGTGRFLTAITLAKALNCVTDSGDSCDACRSCHLIDLGNHPDVKVAAPERMVLKIEQIRDIQQDVSLLPYSGRKKIYILKDAETMNDESANAFLKTLEEPAGEVIFILIADNLSGLLSTIVSRCHVVKFRLLLPGQVIEILSQHGIEPDSARLAAVVAEGQVDRALELTKSALRQQREHIFRSLPKLSIKDPREIFNLSKELSSDRRKADELLDLIFIWFRDLLIFKEKEDRSLLVNSDMVDDITAQAGLFSAGSLQRIIERLARTKRMLWSNVNLQSATEVLLFGIAGEINYGA